MQVSITFFKKDEKGNTVYDGNKPVTDNMIVSLPLVFGYGSYNEPKKILNTGILLCDVIGMDSINE